MSAVRATEVLPRGAWAEAATDHVVLDFDSRHRRRMAITGAGGLEFLLDLPQAVELRHGDALKLEDGRLVEIRAAPEPLLEIRCRDTHHLVRVAWHLGNRHLPTQILEDRLRIREDHVIAEMAEKLGAEVARVSAPFDPEGGAYGHGRTHGHSHGPSHDHSHGHDHPHDHSHP